MWKQTYQPSEGDPCGCGCHKWGGSKATGNSAPISITVSKSHGALCAICLDELNQPWEQVLDETLRIAAAAANR